MGVLLMLLGNTVSQQTPRSSGSCNLSFPSSAMFPEPEVQEYFVDAFKWSGLHNSVFWLVVGFLQWSPLQREVSLMREGGLLKV